EEQTDLVQPAARCSDRQIRSRDSSLYGIRVVKRGRGSSQNRDRSNEFKSHLVDRQHFRPDWLRRIAEIKIHDDRPKISFEEALDRELVFAVGALFGGVRWIRERVLRPAEQLKFPTYLHRS